VLREAVGEAAAIAADAAPAADDAAPAAADEEMAAEDEEIAAAAAPHRAQGWVARGAADDQF
jgi:hypothetical protein